MNFLVQNQKNLSGCVTMEKEFEPVKTNEVRMDYELLTWDSKLTEGFFRSITIFCHLIS